MLFLWFDHPLIEGWTEARLWAELHREDAATSDDRPVERLEVPMIEALPGVASELVEPLPVHLLDEPHQYSTTTTGGAGNFVVATSCPGSRTCVRPHVRCARSPHRLEQSELPR